MADYDSLWSAFVTDTNLYIIFFMKMYFYRCDPEYKFILVCAYNFYHAVISKDLRQHRTEIVLKMRRQIFRQIV